MNIADNRASATRHLHNKPLPATRLIVAGLLLAGLPAYAIRGGQPAAMGQWTYHVGVFQGGAQMCGGTLVAPRFVLTAAHCASGTAVYVGSQELTQTSGSGRLHAGTGQLINVAAVHVHPRYDGNRTHDVALLELATAAPASGGRTTLPNLAIHNRIAADGAQAVAIGWGTPAPYSAVDRSTWPPTRLQQASLTLKSQDACRALMGNAFDREAHICTQDVQQGRGICNGDSGGPLFVRGDGVDYQIGIASFAESFYSGVLLCSTSGFTKVAAYVDWIDELVNPGPVDPGPVNRAPEVALAIGDLWLLPDASRQIDASAVFRDQDGDRLAYSARSSDPAVATATVQEETVSIVARALGATTITLAATDPQGLSARLAFSVQVKGPPRVVGEVADVLLLPGAFRAIDPTAVFVDPDGDPLDYAAQSAHESVATVTQLDGLVRVSAVAPGRTTITLTATDTDGLSAELVFSVQVKGPPEVAGEITDIVLPPGASQDIDPTAVFVDPDGDSLAYEAQSAQPSVATATQLDGLVRVSAVAPGRTAITLTATDADGLSASLRFPVAVSAPLRNQELLANGDVLAIPLSSLFAAPGHVAEPVASSSDPALVTASVVDGILTLASVGTDGGVVTVSVAATGGDGWRKTLRFQVEVIAMSSFLKGWRIHWIEQLARPGA